MSADLIRRFYTSCPLYLWPVLWVQVILMNAKLAHYRARAGGEEIDCFIGLSHRGTLHIVWLSDNATGYIAPDAWRPVYTMTFDALTEERQPDYAWHNVLLQRVSAAHAPVFAAACTTALHLDPG